MAELMQAARRSSSSSPSLLSRIEGSEREESMLFFPFGSWVSPPDPLSAASDDPVEDPELPDLPSADDLGR